MCRWYCTSTGPSTNLECLHCHKRYCAACLHGEAGVMESLVKCAFCGKKPRTKGLTKRGDWQEPPPVEDEHMTSPVPLPSQMEPISEEILAMLPTSSGEEMGPGYMDEDQSVAKLENIFNYYCSYAPSSVKLDNVKWMKCIKELGLIDNQKIQRVDVDLVFTRVKRKQKRKIGFAEFILGINELAKKKYDENDNPLHVLLASDLRHIPAGTTTTGQNKFGEMMAAKESQEVKEQAPREPSRRTPGQRIATKQCPLSGGTVNQGEGEEGKTPEKLGDKEMSSRLSFIFDRYCKHAPSSDKLDQMKWFKAIKELGLIDKKNVLKVDVDLIFQKVKPKGSRKLNFLAFCEGIQLIAEKKFPGVEDPLLKLMTKHLTVVVDEKDIPEEYVPHKLTPKRRSKMTPSRSRRSLGRRTASQDGPSIFERLTDPSSFTGMYKHS